MRDVKLVAVEFWIAQWRRLSIHLVALAAGIGTLDDVQPFRVGGHDAIFDAVMDHFDEMTAAVRPTIEIAIFRLARLARRANRTRRGGDFRCKGLEDGIKMPDNFRLAADHLAVATLQPPYSSTYPDIDIMEACHF